MCRWLVNSTILAPAVLSFSMALLLQITAIRIRKKAPVGGPMGGALCAGVLLCIAWIWIRHVTGPEPIGTGHALTAVLLYLGLAYVHADLYGFHCCSLRLRALRVIHQHGGVVRQDELARACRIESTVDQRLSQYVRSGDLVVVDHRYRLARRRILTITRCFRTMRRLLLGTCHGHHDGAIG